MNKLTKIMLPIGVLVVSYVGLKLMVAGKPEPEKKESTERTVSLYVTQAQQIKRTIDVETQGEVRPKNEIPLTSRVSGHVISISEDFDEGAAIDADTVLVKIDDTDYKVAVIRAEARVAEAQVALERELANEKMKKDTWDQKKGDSKPSPFALNKPQVLEAEAKLRAAKADLQEAQLNVQRTEIKVPFKGRVVSRDIGLGQYVAAGTLLGRVFSVDTAQVRLPLTDLQLATLKIPLGFEADAESAPKVTFTTEIGRTTHQWQGRIVRTNAAVDQNTRLTYAIAEVQDPYGEAADNGAPFAVGMFVIAHITGSEETEAWVLPRDALRQDDSIYVVDGDNNLRIRQVEVYATTADEVMLKKGIHGDEQVVTSTVNNVYDGMKVIPLSKEKATAAVDNEQAQPALNN
ncbi:efflux RND transporter periplasmic adaptor subunit [Marinicella gelatinilytica]|uniref:efflux RND transporter periplasmic adaptor subunit n=1 Tax=Marinicella gelatinilytica TaxID=2996017 RepID=UPI002260AEAE|nr:efflux RND transporter periplasmic adaptor subunit [Marinicella gelatinilytica]MCX7545620.1 efflux RND transporter periplasmic adaptor subunit [Marinicella gelatinilytica]